MSSHYKQFDIGEVSPGMILSDNLIDQQGKLLLSKGFALTESVLATLKRNGVETLPIECTEASATAPSVTLAMQEKRIATLFRKQTDDGVSSTLRQYIEHFRLGAAP